VVALRAAWVSRFVPPVERTARLRLPKA